MTDRRRWTALIVVCLGQLMVVLDTTIVNVALPRIDADLGFAPADLTWVVNTYLIGYGSFLLLAGRLGDLIGRKKMFLGGVVVFTLASALCGLADDQTLLLVARFVQGVGGAAAASVIVAIIVTEFPGSAERAKAMSAYTFVVVGGASLGLLTGGALTEALDWHWIFFINVPVGILAIALGWFLIDENEGLGIKQGVDVLGSVLITASTAVGAFAIVKASDYGWTSARTLGLDAAALALLAGFLLVESRVRNPIVPLRILRLRSLMGSSVVRGLMVSGLFGCFFFGALYLQRIRGYDAVDTGLAFLPQTVVVAALSLGPTAWLVGRFGAKATLIAGLIPMIAGLVALTTIGEHTPFFPGVVLAYGLIGLGAGLTFMPLLHIAMAEVPRSDAGLASGIVNVSLQVSAALGLAALGSIAASHTRSLLTHGHDAPSALLGGYHLVFGIAAGCVVVALVVAVTILRAPRPAEVPPEAELEGQAA